MSKKSWLIGGMLAAALGCGSLTLLAEEVTPGQVAKYREHAEKGNAKSQFNLGECYKNGWGVPQNHEEAVKWFRMAAGQGHVWAQLQLGMCYEFGEGIEKDFKEALFWYRASSKNAKERSIAASEANFRLGWCYEFGKGIKRDYRMAASLYLLSTDCQGIMDPEVVRRRKMGELAFARVTYKLGVCYEKGDGEKQNIEHAVVFYHDAAALGYEPAKKALERLKY